MTEPQETKASQFFKRVNNIAGIIIVFVSLIALYHGAIWYISNEIEQRIEDPEFISTLAKKVRPFLIFDQNGTIIHDGGGAQFIKDIEVENGKEEKNKKSEPKKILILTTQHLNTEPIVECLNYNFYIKCNRFKTIDWSCELSSADYMITRSSKHAGEWRFRLEIIR